MKIDFKVSGLKEAQARLRGLGDNKIKAATVAALNDGARAGYDAARAEMQRVFDRPTPWALGGARYVKATKQKIESSIDFDKWGNKQGVTVEKVLTAQIEGGQRKAKRHEVALRSLLAMPRDMLAVPGAGAEIDRYGNMSSGQIRQIQAFFGAAELFAGVTANSTAKTRAKLAKDNKRTGARGFEYFVVADGTFRTWSRGDGKAQGRRRMQPGIYKRTFTGFGSAIIPVIIFVKRANYQRRFDFYGVGTSAAQKQIDISFDKYLDQMLRERGL